MNALRGEEIEMKRRHGPGRKWALEQSEEDEVRERGSSKILWGVLSFILRGERENDSVMSDSLWPHGLYSPWNSPGQNTGVGCLSFLQGIFPAQGSNPGLPYCRQILYQLSHKGSPGILEWVAYPFHRGSSWPRNQTGVSCFAGGFFTELSF